MSEHSKVTKELVQEAEMLNLNDAGGIEAEDPMERTWKLTQEEIVQSVGLETARSRKEYTLDGGPYCSRYTRNGRYVCFL